MTPKHESQRGNAGIAASEVTENCLAVFTAEVGKLLVFGSNCQKTKITGETEEV